jgi:hypothetical protein
MSTKTVRDLRPGGAAYWIREMHREPDPRIESIECQLRDLGSLQFEKTCSQDGNGEELKRTIADCERRKAELLSAPDRVCRLMHLDQPVGPYAGKTRMPFAEWLARQKRTAPIILRYGAPVPPEEQDGYYQRDYQDWVLACKQQQADDFAAGQKHLNFVDRHGFWTAEVMLKVSADGRTRAEAFRNACWHVQQCLRECAS